MANTITLACYRYDESEMQTYVLGILNEFFTWIFFIEMCMKLHGLGAKNYIRDGYNIFDAVIVIISLIDYTLTAIMTDSESSALKAFRALRLLRMIKLSRQWKALKVMMGKIV